MGLPTEPMPTITELAQAHDRPRTESIQGIEYVHTPDRIYWAWRVLRDYQDAYWTGRERRRDRL